MRRRIAIAIAVIVLITGLGFLLFPPISNFIGKQKADESAKEFDKTVDSVVETIEAPDGERIDSAEEAAEYIGSLTDEERAEFEYYIDSDGGITDRSTGKRVVFKKDLKAFYDDSLAYNKMLLTGQGTEETIRFDKAALNVTEYSLIDYSYGYITAPSIDLRLPIFLGASDDLMSYGAAHLYGTSLPLGAVSENCAIAGHTDYIGRIFFDNIRKLKKGDKVSVTNYWDTIDYEVIDYKIVSPDDFSELVIRSGRQLLTLITCVSDNKGGFDRYLVICEHKRSDSERSQDNSDTE